MTEPVHMVVWRHRGKANEVGFQTVTEDVGRDLIAAGVAQDAKVTDAMQLESITLEREVTPAKPPEYETRVMTGKVIHRGRPRT